MTTHPLNDIEQASDEQLDRRLKVLNMAKFEQELEQDRERFKLDRERYEFERQQDRERLEQDRERLEQDRKRFEQYRLRNEATIEQMRLENDKFRAETAKLNKENRFYPMLTITMGVVAVIGGIVAGLITKLL